MAAVNRSPHLAYLLHMATRRLRAEAESITADTVTPLRAAQARLLDLIPECGGRVTDLAAHVRVSKQGLGQLAQQLADRGLVEMSPDPADRRARVVRRTANGDQAARVMRDVIAVVEDRWRAEVGAERYATFRDVLAELVQGLPGAAREADEPRAVS